MKTLNHQEKHCNLVGLASRREAKTKEREKTKQKRNVPMAALGALGLAPKPTTTTFAGDQKI